MYVYRGAGLTFFFKIKINLKCLLVIRCVFVTVLICHSFLFFKNKEVNLERECKNITGHQSIWLTFQGTFVLKWIIKMFINIYSFAMTLYLIYISVILIYFDKHVSLVLEMIFYKKWHESDLSLVVLSILTNLSLENSWFFPHKSPTFFYLLIDFVYQKQYW